MNPPKKTGRLIFLDEKKFANQDLSQKTEIYYFLDFADVDYMEEKPSDTTFGDKITMIF